MATAQITSAASAPARLGYRPALDGVRAIAIVAVVGYHAFKLPVDGFLGVDIFFVLSGFLITTLLLEEWQTTHSVSLMAFYRRRAYRLLPALVLLLGALALVWSVQGRLHGERVWSLVEGFGYVMNLVLPGWFGHGAVTSVSHLWSLALEEQFYLVWPLVLFFVLRGRRRVALGVLGACLVAATVDGAVRIDGFLTVTGDGHRALFAPDTRSVGIIAGCMVALAFSLWPGALQRLAQRTAIPALLGLLALTFLPFGLRIFVGLLPVYAACAGALIVVVLTPGRLTTVLSLRPIRYLGRISYSLYLWHLPVLVGCGAIAASGGPARSIFVRLGAVAASVMLAAASYHFVEQPFLRRSRRPRVRAAALSPAAAPAA